MGAPSALMPTLPGHSMASAEVPAVEALRGLAALMVIISHYAALVMPSGVGVWGVAATGVDLFFVLSGFVFARALTQAGFAVGPHLVRRFFRLYPLYVVALLAYALLKSPDQRWSALWPHLLMLHTSQDLATAAFYNVAFWSLPPEVEFYLALPLLALFLSAWARRSSHALWGLVAWALLMKLALVALAVPGEPADSLRSILTVHLPGLLVEFLLGCVAAAACGQVSTPAGLGPWTVAQRRAAALGGVVLLAMAVWVYRHHLAAPALAAQASAWLSGNFGLWVALGFALMLPALVTPSPLQTAPGPLPQGFSTTLALWLGRLSYGLYLFHNAAPEWLRRVAPALEGWGLALASLTLTVAVAWLLHLAVEAPCRAYGRALASAWQRAISTRMSGESR